MQVSEMFELFEKYDDFSGDFKSIKNRLSKRRDLHVFLLLDSLLDTDTDILYRADNDLVYMCGDLTGLAKTITEDNIKELRQCGVFMVNGKYLAMFV